MRGGGVANDDGVEEGNWGSDRERDGVRDLSEGRGRGGGAVKV